MHLLRGLAVALVLAACGDGASGLPDGAPDAMPVVAPTLAFETPPPAYLGPGEHPLGTVIVRVVGPGGAVRTEVTGNVTLTAQGEPGVVGGTEVTLERGRAVFQGLRAGGAGVLRLRFQHPRAGMLEAQVVCAQTETFVPIHPREARVRQRYEYSLQPPAEGAGGVRWTLARGALPEGVTLDGQNGRLLGTPTSPEGAFRVDVAACDEAYACQRQGVHLALFDDDDSNNDTDEDLTADGPFVASHRYVTLPAVDGVANVRLYLTYPSTMLNGPPAEGRHPVVVFHHGVAAVGTAFPIFDRYEALFDHWATRGYVTVSIDATRVYFRTSASSSILNLSYANLLRVHRFLQAEVAWLRAADTDPEEPLHGHLDLEHMIASGHSRGGGGTMVALDQNPDFAGFMALQPVSPLLSPGGSAFNHTLPPRPLLLVSAGRDGDVVFPIVDNLYEQTTGPTSLVTIRGGKHTFSKRVPVTEMGSAATITQDQFIALSQVYTVAFLDRYTRMDLSRESIVHGPRGQATTITSPPDNGVTLRTRRYTLETPVTDFQAPDAMTNTPLGAVTNERLLALSVESPYSRWLNVLPAGVERTAGAALQRALHARYVERGGRVLFALGDTDLRPRRALVLSVTRDNSLARDATVRLRDTRGAEATVSLGAYAGHVGLTSRWVSSLVPLQAFRDATPALDLEHIAELAFLLDDGANPGDLWLDDLRFE